MILSTILEAESLFFSGDDEGFIRVWYSFLVFINMSGGSTLIIQLKFCYTKTGNDIACITPAVIIDS